MSERRPGLGETATWDADQGAGGGRDARPSGASAAPSLPPRFRPERLIGSGGQADVWLAHDLELNEPVAVKLFRAELDEVSRERLRREVRLGRTLSHERLVRMFELIEAGDRLAVAMEWVPGGSVAERLRAGPVSVEEAARIGRDTLEALAYLHAQGVIHRDVKPSNLLLDARGSVRLADFGLARPVGEAFDLTRTALSIGTPGYMSPEQIRGEPLGPATDLYGVGVTLFELLTGKQPFDGASAFEVARKHVSVAPPDPAALRRECPAWLSRFVLRLLEKSQGDRFPTAAVALEALSSRGSTASPRERRRRRRLLIGAAATFVGVALAWRPLSARLDPPSVVRAVVEGGVVRGMGPRGEPVFLERFEGYPPSVLSGDLDGDRRAETVLTWVPKVGDGTGLLPSVLRILDSRGRRVVDVAPESVVDQWPFEASVAVTPKASLLDLDGDGFPEVVVRANHRIFFPAALLVYWPRLGRWETLLLHSGWIEQVDVVGSGAASRLRFRGINNRLGMLSVEGELAVRPPGGVETSRSTPVFIGPGLTLRPEPRVGLDLVRYVLVGEGRSGSAGALMVTDGAARPWQSEEAWKLDRSGNPVGGPNEGLDLEKARVGFVSALMALVGAERPRSPEEAASRLSGIAREAGPLLKERAYRGVFAVHAASALAQAGDVSAGLAALGAELAGDPIDEVLYRAANLELASGRLPEGLALLDRLAIPPRGNRDWCDGHLLRVRARIELGDREGFRRAVRDFVGPDVTGSAMWGDAHQARAHLWWDEVTEADGRARPLAIVPGTEAVASLARWRMGRTRPDDVEKMQALARTHPEAREEALLAEAAALLSLERPVEALVAIDRLVDRAERRSAEEFDARQTLDLARALRTKALLASGEVERAREEAVVIRTALRPGLLPRKLVDEVLEGTESGAGRSAPPQPARRLSSAP